MRLASVLRRITSNRSVAGDTYPRGNSHLGVGLCGDGATGTVCRSLFARSLIAASTIRRPSGRRLLPTGSHERIWGIHRHAAVVQLVQVLSCRCHVL